MHSVLYSMHKPVHTHRLAGCRLRHCTDMYSHYTVFRQFRDVHPQAGARCAQCTSALCTTRYSTPGCGCSFRGPLGPALCGQGHKVTLSLGPAMVRGGGNGGQVVANVAACVFLLFSIEKVSPKGCDLSCLYSNYVFTKPE